MQARIKEAMYNTSKVINLAYMPNPRIGAVLYGENERKRLVIVFCVEVVSLKLAEEIDVCEGVKSG